MLLRRGDIVLADFDPAQRGEAAATRPAIVITNNIANELAEVIVVVPLTTNLERTYPYELMLPNNRTGLDHDSKVQVQYVRHLHKRRIKKSIGYVPPDLMEHIDTRIRTHLGL